MSTKPENPLSLWSFLVIIFIWLVPLVYGHVNEHDGKYLLMTFATFYPLLYLEPTGCLWNIGTQKYSGTTSFHL